MMSLRTIGSKLQTNRLTLFEAIVSHQRTGLTIPDIVEITGIPSTSVDRIVKEYDAAGILIRSGKRGKAPVFHVNMADEDLVDAARTLQNYTLFVAEREGAAQGIPPAGPSPHRANEELVIRIYSSPWEKETTSSRFKTTKSVRLEARP